MLKPETSKSFYHEYFEFAFTDSIHRHIKEFAKKEVVSIKQFIATAVVEKFSTLATEDYLHARARRAETQGFAEILAKVEDRAPVLGDE